MDIYILYFSVISDIEKNHILIILMFKFST